jgi:NAD(P)-dependent dehydrogenase (short-subunit alcohol dehydrogenase family)
VIKKFEGKVCIVTGGGQGIGGGIARKFAQQGSKVMIADINDSVAKQNKNTIESLGGIAQTVHTDVSKSKDIENMVNTTISEWGRIDFLIQNAFGVSDDSTGGSAMEVTEKAWDSGISVLTKALFLGAKFAGKHLIETKGSIINISSVHGFMVAPKSLVYEAGKSAVIGMTRQMACDFGPEGVRVNCICPGHIVTENIQEQWNENPSGLKFFDQQYPVRRTGTPEDIANAVSFLCSEDASFITGHSLVVDGGLTIQIQENLGISLAKYAIENPETEFPF